MVYDGISLSLGAASFAFQIFEGIKLAYGFFEDAAHMPDDCASLRLRLLFEYTRFLDWGDAAGLSDVSGHGRFDLVLKANRPMILAALSELQARLQRLTKIRNSFEELQQVDRDFTGDKGAVNLKERDTVTAADMEPFKDKLASQDVMLPGKQNSKGISLIIRAYASTKDIAMHPKRLRWSLVDKERFEQNLRKIKELTDFLHEMLGDSNLQKLLELSRETGLGILQLNTGLIELKALLTASTLALRSEDDDAGSVFSQAKTLVNEHRSTSIPAPLVGSTTTFEQLTRFRLKYSEIYAGATIDPSIEIDFDRLQLDKTLPDFCNPTDSEQLDIASQRLVTDGLLTRMTGRLKPLDGSIETDKQNCDQIWIEWREYNEIFTGLSANGITPTSGPADSAKQRVEQLVMLLKGEDTPAEFCIPTCVGFCQDEINTRFGFIYAAKLGSSVPHTLRQLLSREPASLSSRIKTAQSLATSVLFLHAVGWLHKDLHSNNIIFDEDVLLPDLPGLQLTGFGYARPDETGVTTKRKLELASTAIYRHPDHQGLTPKQYRKSYDYYSLGIILIELAYWKTMDNVIREQSPPLPGSQSIDTKTVRERVLQTPSILDQVRLRMGERYANATKSCIIGLDAFGLQSHADETDPTVNTILQLEFLHTVVNTLRSVIL